MRTYLSDEKTYASIKDEVYSSFKMIHHKDKLEAIKDRKRDAPICLQIDLMNLCQHNCNYCAYRSAGFDVMHQGGKMTFDDRNNLSKDVAFQVIKEAQEIGIKSVEITGGGEPTLAPYFTDLLKATGDLELAIVTNGQKLLPKTVNAINPEMIRWIRFSIDAMTPDTHKTIHFGGNERYKRKPAQNAFETIIENLKYVVEKKKEWHKDFKLGVSFDIVRENIHEIEGSSAFFKKIGVDNIRYSFTYDINYDGRLTAEEREEVHDRLEHAKRHDDGRFRVFGWNSRLEDYSSKNNFGFCSYQYGTMAISGSGGVFPCCIVKEYKNHEVGNVNRQTLKEILLGSSRKVDFCVTDCPPCWLKSKNQFFNALVDREKATQKLLGDEKYKELVTYKNLPDKPHVNYP